MIQFQSNLPAVINTINLKLTSLDVDKMTRLQATSLLAMMRVRIHINGNDSNGTPIGAYTPAYVKYTRIKAGRGTDNKVILSLTRAMEQSMELYPIQNGTGIGFSTKENWQKAKWCEETYGKKIYAPTAEERNVCIAIAQKYIKDHISNV